jgi:hypothetical protein
MILAAADFAEKKADRKDAPRELQLAWQNENFGLTFPVADMEAGLLNKMAVCLNVYNAVIARDRYVFCLKKTTEEFKKAYPHQAEICAEVKKLRELSNGE